MVLMGRQKVIPFDGRERAIYDQPEPGIEQSHSVQTEAPSKVV